jgi:hypothetical protein
MGLLQLQQALAKIYTDTASREKFLDPSPTIDRELELSEKETQYLTKISSQQVNLFATSLKRKRLGQIRKLLPLTSKCLEKDFSQLFWQYSETYIPQGLKKHQQDAIEFTNFIEKKLDRNWIIDVLRYERSWLTMETFDRLFFVCRFNYAIAPLIESLQQSENELITTQRLTFAIWFRLSDRSKIYYFQFRSRIKRIF